VKSGAAEQERRKANPSFQVAVAAVLAGSSIGSRLWWRPAWARRFSRRLAGRARVVREAGVGAARKGHEEEVDVVVIGAGIGGLACAGLLARTGRRVVVCESHSVAGGVAHAFKYRGYEFDSGPSLLSGVSASVSSNPLRHVLNALGEDCEWTTYPGWRMVAPGGDFDFQVGNASSWEAVIHQQGGANAVEEWRRLLALAAPLGEASKGVPAAALRSDLGAARTLGRFLPRLPEVLLNGMRFQAPFADLMREAGITNSFLRNWFDYLCFVLQALPADKHPTAPVAYMLSDMHMPGAALDYPRGGMGALVDALVRGVERQGGELRYGAHVQDVMLHEGRASGVRLRGGGHIRAREGVVSNASIWDTERFLPEASGTSSLGRTSPELCGSFMHLHLGLRADQLPKDLQLHYSVIRSWEEPVDATGNVVIISIPSTVNPDLAPPGRHCLHAYHAATEPYAPRQDLKRGTHEYEAFKKERAQPLFDAVERAVPGALEAIELELIGSPLTHARFCRRHRGSYGPLVPSSAGMLPGPRTDIDGLFCCGDSTFPGIGVPAAAASGCAAAAALISVDDHLEILEAMQIP